MLILKKTVLVSPRTTHFGGSMRILGTVFVTSIILSFAPGSALAGSWKSNQNQQQAAQQQTQEFVDARMHETLSSIDSHLTTLVSLSRSGEAPRKPGIIGPTVAGAAGPARSIATPAAPYSTSPVLVDDILARRVTIQWNGSASDLLKSMSSQLGLSYHQTAPVYGKVRLEGHSMTVEQTLNLIAKQIHGQADIVLSLPNRSLTLAKK